MKKTKTILSYLILFLLSIQLALAQNPSVVNGVATYTSNVTIGQKFQPPNNWTKIVINAHVTVTGSFYFPTRTSPIEIMGIDSATSIIHGTGSRPRDDGMNGRSYSAIRGDGKNLYIHVHDLKSLNPDKFHFINESGSILVERCRIIEDQGITQTDAVHCANGGGTVKDCYISTFDDVCYIGQVILMENTTIQHNNNGAPFQVGWNSQANGNAMTVNNCTIIDCSTRGYNQGVVGWAGKPNSTDKETVSITWTGNNVWKTNKGANTSPFYTFSSGSNNKFSNAFVNQIGGDCQWAKSIDVRNGSTGTVTTKNCGSAKQIVPLVSFFTPKVNVTYPAGSDVDVLVNASVTGSSISMVKLYVNGKLLSRQPTTSPFEWGVSGGTSDAQLRNMNAGTYQLKAVAYDKLGDSTVATTTFIVNAITGIVSITASSDTTFCSGGSVQLNTKSMSGYTYQWKHNGAVISGATIVSYTAKVSGSYTVTITKGGLNTSSSAISVTVNALPIAPTVTNSVTYCQNAPSVALTATGKALQWYTVSTGGTSSTIVPIPVTTKSGTTDYYVSQTVTGCEGPRSMIAVTVNALPIAPTVTNSVTYCQNAPSVALTATGKALQWYSASTGGSSSTIAPIPVTTKSGTTDYYVSQTVTGCEGPRSMISVIVNALPTAPTVTTPVTYSKNALSTALTATGKALQWYTVSTGGTSLTTAPIPLTTKVGTTDYYVSQTVAGCEGPRSMVAVTITALPIIPPAVSITSPTNNSNFTAPSNVIINASASDADGSVTKVDFYNGTILLASDESSPYSYTWTNVTAGSYTITAKATDNQGSVTSSSSVIINVTSVVSTADIIGSNCVTDGTAETYTLNILDRTNATTYSWWYTGSMQNITSVTGEPYSIVLNSDNDFSAGEVCVGVNYSVSPWYKQFCLPLSACTGTNRLGVSASQNEDLVSTVYPNPTSSSFNLNLTSQANQVLIVNQYGIEVDTFTSVSGSIQFGNSLNSGIYYVIISYANGSSQTKKVVKVE